MNPFFARIRAGRKLAWLVAVTLAMFAGVCCHAATYYVDFAGGSDANPGISPDAPWRHCPGDTNGTGVCATKALVADDVVILKGGVEYTNQITLKWSGKAGHPITYDGNSQGTFGTGRAYINRKYAGIFTNVAYGLYGTKLSNVVVQNLEIGNIGSTNIYWECGDLPSSHMSSAIYTTYGIYISYSSAIVVSNCFVHDVGCWLNVPNNDQSMMQGYGILFDRAATNIVVANCELTRIARASIGFSASTFVSNILILNCDVHDYQTWGLYLAANGANSTLTGITVDGYRWHDYYQCSVQTWKGCLNDYPHIDGVMMLVGSTPQVPNTHLGTPQSPIIIRNSMFYNNYQYLTNTGGNACIFITSFGGRVLMYNNVFLNVLNAGNGGILFKDALAVTNGGPRPDYHMYNNTFYDQVNGISPRTASGQVFALTNGTMSIKNNLFYHVGNLFYFPLEDGLDPYSAPTELDYNMYITSRANQQICDLLVNGVRKQCTFAQVQAIPDAVGGTYEAHGIYCSYGPFNQSIFQNCNVGLGANSMGNDLHLKGISPSIHKGANLSAFFNTDKDGNPRPATGSWCIGAYEYKLLPPSNLRLLP